ncbi:MAG: FKBP-type peptidyl-prolyl cis-trans isomerase [Bacteroidia bacterium]|nr:FKBP-type peptidyl-prolyl cis-trans isomerase [Bacteroidia bacterium]
MQINDKKVVTVSYNLHANLPSTDKQHIETADKSHPLSFIFGVGMMIPGFEKNLEGKSNGDSFDFSIEPEHAYGESDETAVVKLPIDIFKKDDVIDFEILKVGNILPMSDNEGNVMNGKVMAFDQSSVTMDFNHPLAGHWLHFSGEVLGVRDATK